MPEPALFFAPLARAIESLERAAAQPKDEFVRDSVIQRFEYTYELAWKLRKRHLERDEGTENVDRLNRKDLYRLAWAKGLITDVSAWFGFHQARNTTSHAYHEDTAEAIYAVALRFVAGARRLLGSLEERSA